MSARRKRNTASNGVPSPCTSVCTMDAASGYCRGCFRTLDEIAAWSVLDDAGKRRVLAALPARRAACTKRTA
jgi:hypothetical protein